MSQDIYARVYGKKRSRNPDLKAFILIGISLEEAGKGSVPPHTEEHGDFMVWKNKSIWNYCSLEELSQFSFKR